jgi:phosphoribosylamine--glycine ligase
VVLPLLESDLFDIMRACTEGTLKKEDVSFRDGDACCVVMASEGYPKKYETGFEITFDDDIDAEIYIAGAKNDDGILRTSGGRVLGVVSVGDDLSEAIEKAYENVKKVHFGNSYCRKDIGQRALRALK